MFIIFLSYMGDIERIGKGFPTAIELNRSAASRAIEDIETYGEPRDPLQRERILLYDDFLHNPHYGCSDESLEEATLQAQLALSAIFGPFTKQVINLYEARQKEAKSLEPSRM